MAEGLKSTRHGSLSPYSVPYYLYDLEKSSLNSLSLSLLICKWGSK